MSVANLSTAQKATFKTWLTTNTNGMDEQTAANLANTLVSAAYFIWQSAAKKEVVDSQISKAQYTPLDAVPASGSTVQISNDQLVYNNRALLCQLKQTNAQWLTNGTSPIDARVSSVRQNFKDCMAAIPSGVSGNNQDAGWGSAAVPGTVRTSLMRQITNYEKLFATVGSGPGNAGGDARGLNTNPDFPGIGADGVTSIEGKVTVQDISDIRAS